MLNNPLVSLLSPRGQKHYTGMTVKELLETYTLDTKHLTKHDKEKIKVFKDSMELYTRTPDLTQQITSSRAAFNFFEPILKDKEHEEVVIALLNTKNYVIHYETVFKGSLSSCVNHPRELFRIALKYPTARILIAHNHPSGDSTPSQADITSTHRVQEAGEMLGINLLDHIIVGNNECTSIEEYCGVS